MREPSDHIRTLQRRVDFLKSREHKNSYDAAEIGSLEWAIVNLQPTVRRQWLSLTMEDKMAYIQQDLGGSRLDAMDWADRRLQEKNGGAV